MVFRSASRRIVKLLLPRIAYALFGLGLFVVSVVGISPSIPIAQATTPGTNSINYQGRLLTNAGAVVADGTYNMEFRIYSGGTGTAQFNGGSYGSPTGLVWTEDYLDGQASGGIAVKNGYFSVNLGSVCALTG